MPESSGDQGTKRAIIVASAADFFIAIAKFVAGFISGSSVPLAEGGTFGRRHR